MRQLASAKLEYTLITKSPTLTNSYTSCSRLHSGFGTNEMGFKEAISCIFQNTNSSGAFLWPAPTYNLGRRPDRRRRPAPRSVSHSYAVAVQHRDRSPRPRHCILNAWLGVPIVPELWVRLDRHRRGPAGPGLWAVTGSVFRRRATES